MANALPHLSSDYWISAHDWSWFGSCWVQCFPNFGICCI